MSPGCQILTKDEWLGQRAAHEARVRPWVEPRLARMSRHERHPVEDFLFEYYSYRPSQLMRWHAGLGMALEDGEEFLVLKGYRQGAGGVMADVSSLPRHRLEGVRWMLSMLRLTAGRPAGTGCFGLHEWAMVYRSQEVRHTSWPLRFSPEETARVVDEIGARCTHYDAFRFFTDAARPLNKFALDHSTKVNFEQPGCLHANMDLYKWAMKLQPFSPSELVADCFSLAWEIRVLDMRASPYDFAELGLEAVRIETAEGRAEYEAAQRGFAAKAAPLRARLIGLCEAILEEAEVSCS